MFLIFEDRPSDSPLVERVWRSHSERSGVFHSIAACHWEMVVSRHEGRMSLIVRGPETQATMAECPADGEWFAIRFKLGTYMPQFRPGDLRDRHDVILPAAGSRSFWLNGSAWDYPDFDHAEDFVRRLARAGLIVVDHAVTDALQGQTPDQTLRTTQRRFLQVTGVTRTMIHQVERARRAALQLRRGVPVQDVVHGAGYYDQAHLIRSLKRWTALTPRQVAEAGRQLSFLYNTTSR